MSRIGQKERKLAVLEVVQRNKDILFSKSQNDGVTKKRREQAWGQVLEKAKELGLAAPNRTWTYARDNIFTLWKNATLAKRDSKNSSTGSRSSRPIQLDAVDEAILEIIEDHSDSSTEHYEDEIGNNSQYVDTVVNVHFVPDRSGPPSKKRKSQLASNEGVFLETSPEFNCSVSKRRSLFERNEVIDLRKAQHNATVCTDLSEQSGQPKTHTDDIANLRKELLIIEIYKTKLEALKLERELKIPMSEYTEELALRR